MREANDELAFAWRGPLDDDEMLDLVASHGGRPERGWWDKVRPHSLGWVTARTADGTLVGFVNVAWDGSDHAILIDTKTGGPFQRRGVGTRLVQVAAEQARAAGCEWLHVDFEAHLQSFYFDACGFTRTDAGVIHLAVGLGCARLGQRCGMSLDRTAGGHVPGSRTQAGQLVVRYPRRAWTIRGRAGDHRFLALLAGCGATSGNVTVFATKGHPEPGVEGRYRELIRRDFATLEPLNAALDACNIGGSIHGCYDASTKMIDALNALLGDLGRTYVPSRYVDGNDAVRHAVQRLVDGFKTRNSGLATNDNTSFVRGNEELKQGNGDLSRAWRLFPADARPVS